MSGSYDPDAARIEMDLDPEVWQDLLILYREVLPPKVQALQAAWAQRDWTSMATILHSLRGVSLTLAVHGVAEACSDLEADLRAGGPTETGLQRVLDEITLLEGILGPSSSSESSPCD